MIDICPFAEKIQSYDSAMNPYHAYIVRDLWLIPKGKSICIILRWQQHLNFYVPLYIIKQWCATSIVLWFPNVFVRLDDLLKYRKHCIHYNIFYVLMK